MNEIPSFGENINNKKFPYRCESRRTIVKKLNKNKVSKCSKRRHRRKRSRKAYTELLKNTRNFRGTEELCNNIKAVTFLDMEPNNSAIKIGSSSVSSTSWKCSTLPEEIKIWHQQDQLAYWKSKAISFEIENKILKEHLRNVYAQQVEYNNQLLNKPWNYEEEEEEEEMDQEFQDEENLNINKSEAENNVSINKKNKEINKVIPKLPEDNNRLEEMKKIYGEMAPKIMGMETALELNYKRLREDGSHIIWPNIPLKL